MKTRKKIGIILIGIVGAIGIFFLYLYNEAQKLIYNVENFNRLYNESRSGNMTILEFCDVHSEDLCNEYKNLHGIK